MPNEKPAKADYEVLQEREIAGQFRKVGDIVPLTERQAKYYLPPFGEGIKLAGNQAKTETVGSLDDPLVKNPRDHASGKPSKQKS